MIKERLWARVFPEMLGSSYRIFVSEQQNGEFKQIAELPANKHYETDITGPWWVWGEKRKDVHFFQVKSSSDFQLANDKPYFFKIVLSERTASTSKARLYQPSHKPIFSIGPSSTILY